MCRNYENKSGKYLKSRLGENIDKTKIKIINKFGKIIIVQYMGTIWAIEKDILKM